MLKQLLIPATCLIHILLPPLHVLQAKLNCLSDTLFPLLQPAGVPLPDSLLATLHMTPQPQQSAAAQAQGSLDTGGNAATNGDAFAGAPGTTGASAPPGEQC
jgi:hypothetical protein